VLRHSPFDLSWRHSSTSLSIFWWNFSSCVHWEIQLMLKDAIRFITVAMGSTYYTIESQSQWMNEWMNERREWLTVRWFCHSVYVQSTVQLQSRPGVSSWSLAVNTTITLGGLCYITYVESSSFHNWTLSLLPRGLNVLRQQRAPCVVTLCNFISCMRASGQVSANAAQ